MYRGKREEGEEPLSVGLHQTIYREKIIVPCSADHESRIATTTRLMPVLKEKSECT